MFIPVHVKTVSAATVGKRLIPVRCEQCGCEYFYELARVGLGSGSSFYGIADSQAARSAQEKSRRELNRRLNVEAELVPCPSCDWINNELVGRYRNSRYRRLAFWGASVAAIGSSASLILFLFTLSWNPKDRREIQDYLILGLGLSLLFGAALYLLRNWLRSRIQPNVIHPLPPVLPIGTPPALVKDPDTGQVEVVRRPDAIGRGSNDWIVFQLGRDALPLKCCCRCLGVVGQGAEYRKAVLTGLKFAVPFCITCSRRAIWQSWRVGLVVFAFSLAAGLAIFFALKLNRETFWILFVGASVISACIGALAAQLFTRAPLRIKVGDASRGVLKLRFRNEEYQRTTNAAREVLLASAIVGRG